jgi:hypothetical protein
VTLCKDVCACVVPGLSVQELLLDENGLGDDRTDPARTQEPGECSDDMNEEDDEIAHPTILPRTANLQECSKPPSNMSKIQIISNHGYFFVRGSDALLPGTAFTFVLAAALTLAHRLF